MWNNEAFNLEIRIKKGLQTQDIKHYERASDENIFVFIGS